MEMFEIFQDHLVIGLSIMCDYKSSLWFNHDFYKISKYVRLFVNEERL